MNKKDLARQLRKKRVTIKSIADQLDVSVRTVHYWLAEEIEPELDPSIPVELPEVWNLEGEFTVVGDVHVDAIDWDFTKKLFKKSAELNVSKLIIAGDLFSFSKLGAYPLFFKAPTVVEEINLAAVFIKLCFEYFDEVYWFIGNHDQRFIASMQGDLTMELIANMICPNENRKNLFTSPYNYCFVDTFARRWLISHAYKYGKTLNVAKELSKHYQMSVIHQHQHLVGQGISDNGKHIVIDNGCLCNEDQTAYAALRLSVMPKFQKSGTIVTDMEVYLFAEDVRLSICSL